MKDDQMGLTVSQAKFISNSVVATLTAVLVIGGLPGLPPQVRFILWALIAVGWLVYGLKRLPSPRHQFGYLAIAGLCITFALWLAVKSQEDAKDRENLDRIKEINHLFVWTSGSIWTGKITDVFFEKDMTDEEARRVLQLPGLDRVQKIHFVGLPVTDLTLEHAARLPSLREVAVEGGLITDEGFNRFHALRPDCAVDIYPPSSDDGTVHLPRRRFAPPQ